MGAITNSSVERRGECRAGISGMPSLLEDWGQGLGSNNSDFRPASSALLVHYVLAGYVTQEGVVCCTLGRLEAGG